MPELVVAIGEILFDRFESREELGGAPTNFAGHVAALGGSAALISAVGNDELGRRSLAELERRGIDLSAVTQNDLPTGTVDVRLQQGQPDYTINRPAAWDAIDLNDAASDVLRQAALVCFGTLAQRDERSRRTIQRAVELAPETSFKLLDVNLRKPLIEDDIILDSIRLANAIKLNDEEVPVVASTLGASPDIETFAVDLQQRFEIDLVMVTCGARGAHLFRGGTHVWVDAVPADRIVSTVGAGDSFTAAAAMSLLQDKSLEEVGLAAVTLAAKTCTHAGGLPPL